MKHLLYLFLIITIYACSPTRHAQKDEELDDGRYSFRQPGEKFGHVYAYVKGDSVSLFKDKEGSEKVKTNVLKDQILIKQDFDLDAITIPFKFRPKRANLPRQLTTDLNGDFFVGYRVDRFRIAHQKTPIGLKRYQTHTGFAIGAFTGIGAAAINPSTTDYRTTDEYTGLVFSRGFALIFGLDNLTLGVATGWDRLTDRDKNIWIYENKPWYGITIGLNLN
jgi:hypothetical protein